MNRKPFLCLRYAVVVLNILWICAVIKNFIDKREEENFNLFSFCIVLVIIFLGLHGAFTECFYTAITFAILVGFFAFTLLLYALFVDTEFWFFAIYFFVEAIIAFTFAFHIPNFDNSPATQSPSIVVPMTKISMPMHEKESIQEKPIINDA